MTAFNQDFSIHAGDSRTLIVNVYGDNLTISGSRIVWVLKNASQTVLVTKTTEASISILDKDTFQIQLYPQDTATLFPDTYEHECKITDIQGNDTTIFTGKITVKRSAITRLISESPSRDPIGGNPSGGVSSEEYVSLGKSLEGGTSDKDNLAAIQSIVLIAKTDKKSLYIPNGKYYVSNDLVIDGIQNIQIDGEIVMAAGKMLEITYDARSTDSLHWYVNRVTGKLRLSGIKNGWTTVMGATELELYANGDDVKKYSIAYSQFVLGEIDTFKIFSEGTAYGWINENNFYGGRMVSISIDGNYGHNNNTFIKPFMESSTITINKGSSNKFVDVRFEDANVVTFGPTTHSNIITQQWANTKRSAYEGIGATVTDNGTNNVYIHDILQQKQRLDLFSINNKTKVFNTVGDNGGRAMSPGLDLIKVDQWEDIYQTDFIPVVNGSMFKFNSDAANWRPVVYMYDTNKNPITGSDLGYITTVDLSWNTSGYYSVSTNTNTFIAVISHANVKYVKIKIATGGSPLPFRFLSLYTMFDKVKEIDLPAKMAISPSPIALSSSPTSGFAKQGQIVSNTAGGMWVCTKSLDRTLSVTTATAGTSITVNDATGIANGDIVGILLDNGETHWTTVSALSGATFTVSALPSQASSGKRIVFNLWAAAGTSSGGGSSVTRTRAELLTVSSKTKNFNSLTENGCIMIKSGLDLLTATQWEFIYDTDLIPVSVDDVITLKSDVANWRPEIYVYDVNKNPITGADTTPNLVKVNGFSWSTGSGNYFVGTNTDVFTATVQQPTVKYIKVKLSSGPSQLPFRYIDLFLMYDQSSHIPSMVYNSPMPIATSSAPSTGFAKVGQLVSKTAGGVWTCTKSLERTVATTATAGATSITVNDATSIANGDKVGILLDDNTTHWTAVSALAGATFTIAALPSQSSAGKRMVFNTWV